MKAAKKSPTKKTPAKKANAKKAPAKKAAPPRPSAKKTPAKKANAKQVAAKKPAPRADYGAPVDGFFAKQPAKLRPITDALRVLIEKAAPDAESSIKWGMPFYSIGANTVCGIGAHKAHVNLILSGPPGTFADPNGLLEGDGKTGRRLKLSDVAELPAADVRGWLETAAKLARTK